MKRKIYNKLLEWKQESNGEYALLIDGTRRVGKSYIVRQFAEKEYRSCVILDFNLVSKSIKDLFENDLDNLDRFFMYLSNYTGKTLYTRDTLIVFDEVQQYPKARAAIKYLVKDGRYDYIETGSLISIKKNVEGIVIPSEEEHIKMFPMDFEEFLWAMGEEMLMPFIKDCFERKKPLGQLMHRRAMDYFRLYMIVGGMPQAVEKYVETRDFAKVDKLKRRILDLYRSDISKYAKGYDTKVKSIFEEIPSQLQKHEKKFRLSALKEGARARDYETAFFWLDDAMIINSCYNTTEPNVGLNLNKDTNTMKCYMADTGLLISHAFDANEIVSEDLYRKILLDKLEMNSGMIVENIVAQMLRTAGHKLFFYSNASMTDKDSRMEIDFLIAKSKITTRHNISPIEVKSSARYTLTSLRKCIAKYGSYLSTAYVIHPADLKEEDNIIYLPLYMCPLL
ncbi:MAG: AAA family ATPase [Prevotellaceae bacterium]|nr:AAA family ATPase [Prevotellaceae bacterium]